MELFFLLLFITPFVFSLSDVPATNSSGCPAYYNHDTHWCAKNSYGEHLCEIVDGLPYFLCGTDQCFNNLQYECNGLSLSVPPTTAGPFYLQVIAIGRDYNLQFIQASSNHFWVGGDPSTYCPSGTNCDTDENTVFYSNSLAVWTPGGQRIYIQDDGALSFTTAHSAREPDVAYDGENTAYEFAGYFGPDGHHWAACRARGRDGRRRIVADLPGVDLESDDCESIFLYVNGDIADDAKGAYQYD